MSRADEVKQAYLKAGLFEAWANVVRTMKELQTPVCKNGNIQGDKK